MVLSDPREIEARSFRIVGKYLSGKRIPMNQKEVMGRVLHATSDLNYIEDMVFHPRSIASALLAIRTGKNIVVDAAMIRAGINERLASSFGNKVICLIKRRDIAQQASRLNITRSALCMRKARKLMEGGIVAIGNAPTALSELCDLIKNGEARPALIIGLPVGFVGAKEAKAKLRTLNIPYITNRSRFGGSSAATACVNALLKMAVR